MPSFFKSAPLELNNFSQLAIFALKNINDRSQKNKRCNTTKTKRKSSKSTTKKKINKTLKNTCDFRSHDRFVSKMFPVSSCCVAPARRAGSALWTFASTSAPVAPQSTWTPRARRRWSLLSVGHAAGCHSSQSTPRVPAASSAHSNLHSPAAVPAYELDSRRRCSMSSSTTAAPPSMKNYYFSLSTLARRSNV